MRKQKGFSLIELLIVVAVILIIAAIAVPNLMRSRMAANEASAVGSLRTINTAQAMYQQQNPTIGYAPDLATLGSTTGGSLLDSTLGSNNPTKSGYKFVFTGDGATPSAAYVVGSAAVSSSSGTREFCTDQSAQLRISSTTFTGTPVSSLTGCPNTLPSVQ
jgi:prepilin-type N-terminal cleavage/methylation domain-containing protein